MLHMPSRIFATISLIFTTAVFGDEMAVKRGDKFTLLVPRSALKVEDLNAWSGSLIYGATVAKSSTVARVNGVEDWITTGFPTLDPLTVRKIRTNPDIGSVE